MKTTKNIARLAVTAGLTAALSFGGAMTPVTMAFAAESAATANGSVTIKNASGNETNFKGYKIFDADVAKDESGQKLVSNITWANDKVETAVTEEIKKIDSNASITTAQDAADWIKTHVTGTDETTSVESGSAAYKIAAVVAAVTDLNDPSDYAATSNGVANNLSHGYWLFVTDTSAVAGIKTATAPIFTVVGDEKVEITEKTSIPMVEKKILDDSKVKGDNVADETEWVDAADSQVGQEVNYKLTGTIADNYASYDSYSYKFTDTLTKGLSYVEGQTKVYAVNKDSSNKDQYTDISNNFTVKSTGNPDGTTTLTVEANAGDNNKHLKEISGVDASTKIVVFYKAKLNAHAAIAGPNTMLNGNPNTVTLEYSNNPMVAGTGTSTPDTVVDYTYGLRINKVDLGTEKALKDAKFTITTKGDEGSESLKYVMNDGTLSDSMVELSTDADGVIELTGLDAGTYTVTETSAPSGYTTVDHFTFKIDPTMNANDPGAGLTGLTGTLDSNNQGDKVIAGLTDKNAGDNKLTAKPNSDQGDDGVFNITVGDTKQIGLPLTGLNGVTFTWIAGGAVLCIGVAHLIRSRKRDEGSEE